MRFHSARPKLSQRVEQERVILVDPELIRHVEESLGQLRPGDQRGGAVYATTPSACVALAYAALSASVPPTMRIRTPVGAVRFNAPITFVKSVWPPCQSRTPSCANATVSITLAPRSWREH